MNFINRLALVAAPVVLMASGAANAAAPTIDLSAITGAFTAGDVTTAVLAVGATLALIYATIKAAKIALGMIRGS